MSRTVLDGEDMSRAITRIAHEIREQQRSMRDAVLLGIPTRGVPLATRIGEQLARIEADARTELDPSAFVGELDVTMYRDDLRRGPIRPTQRTRIPSSGIEGITVVLVDDVLSSGRTIRAALDAVHDIGRPARVQVAVLVDRGHRELPIRADYVGKNLPSARSERIQVRLSEIDGLDSVEIQQGQPDGAAS